MARRLSIASKFFLTHLAVAGIALLIAGTVAFFSVRGIVMKDADETLFINATLVAETFRPLLAARPLDLIGIAQEGDLIGKVSGTRLTVVLPDGTVVADSTVGAEGVPGMDNHESHPEIREALSGVPGFSHRRSITVREEMRYAALPIELEGTVIGAARTAVPVPILTAASGRSWPSSTARGSRRCCSSWAGRPCWPEGSPARWRQMKAAAQEMGAGNLSRPLQIRTGDEVEDVANAMNRMASQLSDTIRQLDAEKARLMTLLANLSDGVIVVAPDRTVRMMNRAAGKILGASETMAEGRPYAEAIRHAADPLLHRRHGSRGEEPKPRDITVPTREGNRTVRLFRDEVRYRGRIGADVLITLRDITEERRLSQVKSDFVSNASHELRTPLTNIRGYLEAIPGRAPRGGTPDPASPSSPCHANALRMERLIDDLLELSRAESGAAPLEMEEISISSFLSRDREPAPFRPPGRRGRRWRRFRATGPSAPTSGPFRSPSRTWWTTRSSTGRKAAASRFPERSTGEPA